MMVESIMIALGAISFVSICGIAIYVFARAGAEMDKCYDLLRRYQREDEKDGKKEG